MTQAIPVTNYPDQPFRITLEGITLIARVWWSQFDDITKALVGDGIEGQWYWDMVSTDGTIELYGMALVTGCDMFEPYAFTGMGAGIAKDVPPYIMAFGNPAEPAGLNKVGLKRRGYTDDQLYFLRQAYKILYKSKLKLSEATERLQEMARESQDVAEIVAFLEKSQRSIIR